ncbi:hypothetical protein [Stappia sp. P2PMeth1]|uniref:hypothetical protein n=1 Tax=Stappia sp. P2PMeth1 TaxID=2003586 RepID=UPI0016442BE7|nr:hypothetical protein [Stappia sp. P2PMeth1]
MITPRRAALAFACLTALSPAAMAEERCFAMETKTSEAAMVLNLPDTDGPVAGTEHGTVQDHEQRYYTSWESKITGTRSGDWLDVTVETEIEEDRQVGDHRWRIDGGAIVADHGRFEPVPCNGSERSGFDNVPDHASDDISGGHCLDTEQVLLSCELQDGDVLSVCAAAGVSALSVRQGPLVAPDLELPGTADGSVERFMIHSLGYSGGYDTRLGLVSGDYTYVVYERMISRGPADPEKDMEGGVLLYEGRTLQVELACNSLSEAGQGLGQLFGAVQEKAFFDEDGLVD